MDGTPAVEGARLRLEDASYQVVAQTTVGADGRYVFADLPPSGEGYTLLFAQEWTPQYELGQVVSWGWLGPVPVEGGQTTLLPDLDLSLLGFAQLAPAPEAIHSAAELAAGRGIVFQWTAYPQAAQYWMDLWPAEEGDLAWQSGLIESTSLDFDGTLDDGALIQAGEYWWGVGARRPVAGYTWTVYGYQQILVVGP